jgi:rSAM/selenodomain-associated transferase 1
MTRQGLIGKDDNSFASKQEGAGSKNAEGGVFGWRSRSTDSLMDRRILIVFVKSPEAGGVKSRLAADIGEEKARRLYMHFVEDLLDSLDKGDFRLKIFFHPPDQQNVVAKWLGHRRHYEPQQGNDLGERMKNAFEKCFSDGFESVILVGGDIPDMTGEIVNEGFADLKSSDAVIGPSHDGGYYLIGFRSGTFVPDVFTGISWGTGGVMKSTRDILEDKGVRLSFLPLWRDIDTCEDLVALIERHRNTPFAKSRTIRFVSSWKRNAGCPAEATPGPSGSVSSDL